MTLEKPTIRLEEIKVVMMPILESKDVQNRLDDLLKSIEEIFQSRFNQFANIIDEYSEEKEFSKKISYRDFIFFFKQYFLMQVVNDAVNIAVTEITEKYNILENILSLLSKETLYEAIYGKLMVNAFSKVVYSLPCKSPIDKDVHTGLTLMLREHLGYGSDFSGWYYFDD